MESLKLQIVLRERTSVKQHLNSKTNEIKDPEKDQIILRVRIRVVFVIISFECGISHFHKRKSTFLLQALSRGITRLW